MTGLAPEPEDRIRPHAAFGNGRRGFGWAAVASLLFHGTALAAVLIAAAGEGPQLPPPAVEVSVVSNPTTGSCTYRTTLETLSENTVVSFAVTEAVFATRQSPASANDSTNRNSSENSAVSEIRSL